MELIVIGGENNFQECKAKFGVGHSYLHIPHISHLPTEHNPETVIFDFEPADVAPYLRQASKAVFVNSVKTTLSKLMPHTAPDHVFGFCGLPSFLNREILETTVCRKESVSLLEKTCSQLGTKFKIVRDQAGMVTPRIICMIINEAYFAIEEDVASRTDIDLAMKLGTNYPYGPFEWCEKIGIKNVYGLLKAVHEDTHDDRYKICELLKAEVLNT
ncbi:MAG: 3-hydroxyacyl-CoA dehydrogenase [Bacteroidetes bacterium]|nr:3-hydroxyacyl-CoA dehydrogenase [Bacteroidota bacterium]MBS1540564.1 3-hydroxyacyl-CoA dehydrogenase [Bacteroidota bacterium]